MKRKTYKRTGHLPPARITRDEAAKYLRKWRKDDKIKIATWTDAKAYQPHSAFNPYVIFSVDQSSTVFDNIPLSYS